MASVIEEFISELTDGALDWRTQAACRGIDPSLWFPSRGKRGVRLGLARAVCDACPVRQECLDYAVRNRILHGVWGGTTEKHRRLLYPQTPPLPKSPRGPDRRAGAA